MKRKVIAIGLILIGMSPSTFAQFGPGGVGDSTTVGMWLRAELINAANATAVDTWFDVSTYGNNAFGIAAAKTPQFVTSSSMNAQPAVRFDGSNDEMSIADNAVLDGSNALTFYVALRPSNLNGSPRGILGKRINFGTSSQYAYTWFFWTGNRLNVDLNTQNNRFNTGGTTFGNNTNYVLGLDYRGDLPAARRARLYSQGVKVRESTESSTTMINSSVDLVLGALNSNYGTYLGADYGEVIHFDFSLDSVEHIIVQNYLSAKFGTTLNDNNIYVGDDPANGNHDFDVAGIGRVNANAIHDDSKGTGIIRISNPTDLNDDEFLFWGHNNGDLSAIETSDVPTGVDARLAREWFVTETDASGTAVDVGAVDISFDLSSYATPTTASDLRLIFDADGDGFLADETPVGGASLVGGSTYTFTGITGLSNGSIFTLGTSNSSQTPLPVELIYFNARRVDDGVLLEWETASEINHDRFSIERSSNQLDWKEIASIEGGGDQTTNKRYRHLDEEYFGLAYYRLRQIDVDGAFTLSNVERIDRSMKDRSSFDLYPNPVQDVFTVPAQVWKDGFQLYAADGRDCTAQIQLIRKDDQTASYDVQALSAGTYILVALTPNFGLKHVVILP